MKQGLIALLCIVTLTVQAQELEWKDMTPEQRFQLCTNDMVFINSALQESVKKQDQGDFDSAQRLNDMAFFRGLRALTCPDPFKNTLREYQDFILQNDKMIACGWHLNDGRSRYTRAELKFTQFDDPEGSLFELTMSIAAYEESKRFCPVEKHTHINELIKNVQDAHDKVKSFGEFIGD